MWCMVKTSLVVSQYLFIKGLWLFPPLRGVFFAKPWIWVALCDLTCPREHSRVNGMPLLNLSFRRLHGISFSWNSASAMRTNPSQPLRKSDTLYSEYNLVQLTQPWLWCVWLSSQHQQICLADLQLALGTKACSLILLEPISLWSAELPSWVVKLVN